MEACVSLWKKNEVVLAFLDERLRLLRFLRLLI
jgi:hypothetical protein